MRFITCVRFRPEHLLALRIEDRHVRARQFMVDNPHVQEAMQTEYAVTFYDRMTGLTLGCFGVLDQTMECWAFLRRGIVEHDVYRPHRMEIVRECHRILDGRHLASGKPCFARVDNTNPRDNKFLTTIGFTLAGKPTEGLDTWYQRNVADVRGTQLDLLI